MLPVRLTIYSSTLGAVFPGATCSIEVFRHGKWSSSRAALQGVGRSNSLQKQLPSQPPIHTRLRSRRRCPRNGGASVGCSSTGPRGEALLILESVGKTHDGEKLLFQDLMVTVCRGDRLALVGENGAGKSSLLKIMAGLDDPDGGSVVRRRGVSVGYLPQDPDMDPHITALDAVLLAESTAAQAARQFESAMVAGQGGGAQLLDDATSSMDAANGWELSAKAQNILDSLGMSDHGMLLGGMSGGQRRRVALAGALLAEPDLLVLDEPTNHLDVQCINWLEGRLTRKGTTMVLVTHDRYFMESCCTGVLELEAGSAFLHSFGGKGSYNAFRQAREERRAAQLSSAAAARTVLRKESEWMRRQPKARSTKARARVQQFYELTAAARNIPKPELKVEFKGSAMQRQGNKVLILQGAEFTAPEGKQIIRDFWYEFERGERIGVVGPNGSGKTTLLDIITGQRHMSGGEREIGETTVISHFTQHTQDMPPHLSLIKYVREAADIDAHTDMIRNTPEKVLERVGFPRSRQHQQVGLLSGGERRRLQLAVALLNQPNMLVLDEPTNDLDLSTVDSLSQLLADYPGCLLVASHDRALMDDTVERLLVLQGDGVVRLFDGTYSQYLEILADQQQQEARQQRQAQKSTGTQMPALHAHANRANGVTSQSAATAAPAQAAPKRRLRLNYRERQEYEKLESLVEDLEGQRDELSKQLLEAGNKGDYELLTKLSEDMAKLEADIDVKAERWLELADRADIP